MSAAGRIAATLRAALSPIRILDKKMSLITRELLAKSVDPESRWLDVGCGLKPFASSFSHARYTGIDVEISGRSGDLKRPDRFFDGVSIPFGDGEFEGVLCTQVLEHVADLDRLVAECNRVLSSNGILVVSVPFVYREHEQPQDFRRFTAQGLTMVLSRAGFSLVTLSKCLSAIETVATVFCVYIHNDLGSRSRFLRLTLACLVTAPVLLVAEFLSSVLPDNGELYCTLIVSAVKTSNMVVQKDTFSMELAK